VSQVGLAEGSAALPAMGSLIGYPRVSTAEQSVDLQTDELRAAGGVKVFTEQLSGAVDRRPQLDRALEQLRAGDTLVVWRLDRLGRSLRHPIDTVTGLDAQDVGFRSLRESIDTTTSGGRLVFHLLGALAQVEREVIRDRTVAGLASARARGRVGGRPPKLTVDQVRTARRLYEERALTVAEIGKVLGVSRTSIYRALHRDLAGVPGGGEGQQRRRRTAAPAAPGGGGGWGRVVTRLVTALVTLAVPQEADAEDAAALVADAAICTALEVVSTAGVEGHLPVPGSLVQHRQGRQPWRVETVTADGAMPRNLAGDRARMPLTAPEPDQVDRTVSSTRQGD